MKKSLRKLMAGVSAAAMLATAMPVVNAFAADEAEATISYREVAEGAIITDYVCDADELVIPAEIDGLTVVGVDNFAFALVSKEVNIIVPETLMLDYIDDEAFMTAAVVNTEIIAPSGATTVSGVVKYWINDVVGMNYTDAEIADAIARAITHIGDVEIADMTTAEAAVAIVREIQAGNCGFSQKNLERLDLVLAGTFYDMVTLEGPDGTDAQTFADGKWNLVYNVATAVEGLPGDMTLDGVVNLYDAIEIAKYMMGMLEEEPSEQAFINGDITEDGVINLYDAIAVCNVFMG